MNGSVTLVTSVASYVLPSEHDAVPIARMLAPCRLVRADGSVVYFGTRAPR